MTPKTHNSLAQSWVVRKHVCHRLTHNALHNVFSRRIPDPEWRCLYAAWLGTLPLAFSAISLPLHSKGVTQWNRISLPVLEMTLIFLLQMGKLTRKLVRLTLLPCNRPVSFLLSDHYVVFLKLSQRNLPRLFAPTDLKANIADDSSDVRLNQFYLRIMSTSFHTHRAQNHANLTLPFPLTSNGI